MLLNLSEALQKGDLRKLAIRGLGMKENEVDTALENHRGDLNEAADQVLKQWWKSQENGSIAYTKLFQALGVVNLPLYRQYIQ